MSYTKQVWNTGEKITADKLNHMEDGIADMSSGYVPTVWQCGDLVTDEKLNHIEQGIFDASNPKVRKDINFIDYDGTIIESYTHEEWANVTALPSNPTHDGLTSQGWNWTLADINDYLSRYPNSDMTVGQQYITDDGKTRLYVTFQDNRRHPYLLLNVDGTVEVDWGDGSAVDTVTGSSLDTRLYADHEYASGGDYVITLDATDGSYALNADSNGAILRKDSTTANLYAHYAYFEGINKVELGSDVSIGNYTFYACDSLKSVTMPKGITSIGHFVFSNCTSIKALTISDTVTSMGNSAMVSCYSLEYIAVPRTVSSMGMRVFNDCRQLSSITIPDSMTSIPYYMMSNSGVKSVVFPNSITAYGNYACNMCNLLASATLSGNANTLPNNMFAVSCSLASITIPSNVTALNDKVFEDCLGMAEYHFLPTTPPTLSKAGVFKNISPDTVIYVPSASVNAYKTAQYWSTYASRIVGE